MTQSLLFLCKTRTAQNTSQECCVETGEVGPLLISVTRGLGLRLAGGRV